MPLPDELSIRAAGLHDVPEILELRRGVGWGAHEWALRLAIEPDSARCFVVEDASGRLVGVGSGVGYPPLGFVGNMIVAEDHRRRGVGGAVLENVVTFLEQMGCTRIELFATEDGRPLYARYGFELIEPGSRARLTRAMAAATSDVAVGDAGADVLDELVAYDAVRFGGERRDLLDLMLNDDARPTLLATRRGAIVGFGWLRADDERIGPWISDDPEAAAAILAEAFRRFPDGAELTTNIPMSNSAGLAWLRAHGVEPDPWDGRMARGAAIPRRVESIYGNAVGALG
jgi:[ribosomal protein S18]-alanine N-acetyltransferase